MPHPRSSAPDSFSSSTTTTTRPATAAAPSTRDLSRSLSRLTLRSGPNGTTAGRTSSLSRRSSMQIERPPVSPLTPTMPTSSNSSSSSSAARVASRALARAPSTPNLRSRASMSALSTASGASTALRRKSSVVGSSRSSLGGSSPPESVVDGMDGVGGGGYGITGSGGGIGSGNGAARQQQRLDPPPQDPYAVATVILQDDCYGHKYSRPRTSAAELENIVERPERVAAAVVGVSVLQVRAGRGAVRVLRSARRVGLGEVEVGLVHSHTTKEKKEKAWNDELAALCDAAPEKLARGEVEIPKPLHAGDLYLSKGSRAALEGCVGAVFEGVDMIMDAAEMSGEDEVMGKRVFVCIRPPGHHCAESTPSGFCFLNNIHLGIAHAARHHGLTHAVILDFDLHHGDGSQAITWSLNDLASRIAQSKSTKSKRPLTPFPIPTIGYFSMHDINSFPCESGGMDTIRNASVNIEGAHNQWIRNVHMAPYESREEFWELYNTRYAELLSSARRFLRHHQQLAEKEAEAEGEDPEDARKRFKAAIFLSAGFDASEYETPGMQRHGVCVPTEFFARFTADAVELAEDLCDGRIMSVLEGGYSDRAITSGVLSHLAGMACSPPDRARYIPPTIVSSSSNGGLTPTLPSTSASSLSSKRSSYHSDASQLPWDASWWAPENLDDLFRHIAKIHHKPPPPPTVTEPRRASNFMAATAASQAKVADVVHHSHPRRMTSHSNLAASSASAPIVVPWEVQAYDLARRWIPEYEGSKPIPAIEKEKPKSRHSIAVPPSTMTLRTRKPPATTPTPTVTDRARRKTSSGALESAYNSTASSSRAPSRVQSRAPSRAQSVARGGPVSTRSTSSAAIARRPSQLQLSTTVSTPIAPSLPTPTLPSPAATARRLSATSSLSSRSSHSRSSSNSNSVVAEFARSPTTPTIPGIATNGDVDSLAAGMQRIKLTYRNAARDRAIAEAEAEADAESAAIRQRGEGQRIERRGGGSVKTEEEGGNEDGDAAKEDKIAQLEKEKELIEKMLMVARERVREKERKERKEREKRMSTGSSSTDADRKRRSITGALDDAVTQNPDARVQLPKAPQSKAQSAAGVRALAARFQ